MFLEDCRFIRVRMEDPGEITKTERIGAEKYATRKFRQKYAMFECYLYCSLLYANDLASVITRLLKKLQKDRKIIEKNL